MNTEYKLFSNTTITRSEIIAAVVSLIIILVAKGPILFNLHYSIDCYGQSLTAGLHPNSSFLLSQGRFSGVILSYFLSFLGIYLFDSFVLNQIMTILSLIMAGLIICRLWSVRNTWLQIAVITLLGVYPYASELFTFNGLSYNLYFCYSIAFGGLFMISKKRLNFIIGVFLIALSIGIYQTIINFLLITVLISIILYLLNNSENSFKINFKKFLKTDEFYRLGGVFLGVILYLLMNKLILVFMGITPEARGDFIGFSDIGIRIMKMIYLYGEIFISDQFIFPQMTKIIVLVLLLFTVIGVVLHFGTKFKINKLVNLSLLLLLLFASTLAIYGINIPLKVWWPVPRVLAAASLYLAGIIVVLFNCYTNKNIRNSIGVLIVIAIYSFVGANNNIFTDQLRINQRDAFRANRLLTRLEIHENFSKVKKIAVRGGSWTYSIPTKTIIGDMNISAYGAGWSKNLVLKEVTGFDFFPLTEEDNKKIEEYCKTNPKPAGVDIVEVIDDIGLLWLQ